jgi:DNA-binding NtrC family response regulator
LALSFQERPLRPFGRGRILRNRLETLILDMLDRGIRLPLAQKDFEKVYLRLALDRNDGHRQATAKVLGIHRNTLKNKLAKHHLHGKNGSNGRS